MQLPTIVLQSRRRETEGFLPCFLWGFALWPRNLVDRLIGQQRFPDRQWSWGCGAAFLNPRDADLII
ncbi:Uncharacterised protein [Vibrio cholerae]|nr:Uncharacterised protein [Vibrio cholerae]CSB52434.1 Uncharacterised protein [Vibrio cholerae]CSB71752.1 Uncharacterised protein [Vibrio cholerae]